MATQLGLDEYSCRITNDELRRKSSLKYLLRENNSQMQAIPDSLLHACLHK